MNTTIVTAEAKARLTEAVKNYTPPAPEKYRALNEVKESIIALRERKASYETIRVMLHGIARVVTLDDIAANDHNLNIPRYVEPKNDQVVLTVDAAMKQLRTSAEAAFDAEDKLVAILKREGLLT